MGEMSLMWMRRVEVYVLSSGCGGDDVDVNNSEAFLSCSSALLGEWKGRRTIARCVPRVSRYCFVNFGLSEEEDSTYTHVSIIGSRNGKIRNAI
jgi:hypothetical protein